MHNVQAQMPMVISSTMHNVLAHVAQSRKINHINGIANARKRYPVQKYAHNLQAPRLVILLVWMYATTRMITANTSKLMYW